MLREMLSGIAKRNAKMLRENAKRGAKENVKNGKLRMIDELYGSDLFGFAEELSREREGEQCVDTVKHRNVEYRKAITREANVILRLSYLQVLLTRETTLKSRKPKKTEQLQ